GQGDLFSSANVTGLADAPGTNGAPATLNDDRGYNPVVNDVTVNEGSPYAVFTVNGLPGATVDLTLSTAGGAGSADLNADLSGWEWSNDGGQTWSSNLSGAPLNASTGEMLVRFVPTNDGTLETTETLTLKAQYSASQPVGITVNANTTTNFDTDDFASEPVWPLAVLMPMLESCLRKLLQRLERFNSLEQRFGIRDFRVTLELENNLKIQHTCLLNEPILEFNKTSSLILQNIGAKLPHKGQEFQHPDEPSFYFKAFQIYKLTIEPLRLTPCSTHGKSELHTQRASLPFERVIQNLELKQAGEAYQVQLQANFCTDAKPQNMNPDLLATVDAIGKSRHDKKNDAKPSCLFRYALQERPLHLVREPIPFSLQELFSNPEASAHHLEYLETLANEDLYALHHPPAPALLLACESGRQPHDTSFVLKGFFDPPTNSTHGRFF
ncbi:hypothetical protein EBR21_07550, partial [bacterium]|nr:hypothetical protein [bacterium]